MIKQGCLIFGVTLTHYLPNVLASFVFFYSTLIFKWIIREIRQRLNYDWTHLILYVLRLDHPLLISITNSN